MKIAIKGHKTRGPEVIDILESLGGKQGAFPLEGNDDLLMYFINERLGNLITTGVVDYFKDYKVYTLEEFEKEFPFKIGDCVQTKPHGEPAIIIGMFTNPATTIAYKVQYKSKKELLHSPETLKFYKEMKEERNITLTLEKAKEWYNNGGELKEVALQAFTEQELNPLPKSWVDYINKYGVPSLKYIFSSSCPNKYIALWKLEQLRDCYRQGWLPDPKPNTWTIWNNKISLEIGYLYGNSFLSFQSEKVAKEFLKNFEPLIKEAGDLI